MHTHCGCFFIVCCSMRKHQAENVILSLFIFKSGAFVVLLVLLCCIHHHIKKLYSKLSLFVSHYVTWLSAFPSLTRLNRQPHNWIGGPNLGGIKRLFWQTSLARATCAVRVFLELSSLSYLNWQVPRIFMFFLYVSKWIFQLARFYSRIIEQTPNLIWQQPEA